MSGRLLPDVFLVLDLQTFHLRTEKVCNACGAGGNMGKNKLISLVHFVFLLLATAISNWTLSSVNQAIHASRTLRPPFLPLWPLFCPLRHPLILSLLYLQLHFRSFSTFSSTVVWLGANTHQPQMKLFYTYLLHTFFPPFIFFLFNDSNTLNRLRVFNNA